MPRPPYLLDVPGLTAGLTDDELQQLDRDAADVALRVRRKRRALDAITPEAERWAFAVPRYAAHLFDAMRREGMAADVLALDVLPVASSLGMDAAALLDALGILAAHELATVTGDGLGSRVTLHPEGKCWF